MSQYLALAQGRKIPRYMPEAALGRSDGKDDSRRKKKNIVEP